ncbi:MAG: tetratricopeptide repeat protein [Acidobacteriota bacterium]
MAKINCCPFTGSKCSKTEPEIIVQKDTFFLAEPFQPEKERDRRERAVKNALKEALKEEFSEKCLRVADKEQKEQAFFCSICRSIQCSAYGIVDISELNPNVLLEMGMMFALSKPVFVLVKSSEEENLKEKLPTDITWMRVIPYEEATDFEEALSKQIQERPQVEPELPLAEKMKELFSELAPSLANEIEAKIPEIKIDKEETNKNLKMLLKEAGLSETIPQEKKIEIPRSIEKQIDDLYKKIEQIERITGFAEDPIDYFLKANWYAHRKEHDRAIVLYDRALTLKPDFWEAWYNQGNSFSELERHEESIACYAKTIEIKPDFKGAWNNKGISLSKLGRWEEARYCFEEALKINPNSISTLHNLSETLLVISDSANCLKTAEKALGLSEQAEQKAISWFLLISAYFFKSENERAQEEIKSFINYFRGLEKDFKVTEWDFSPLLPAIEERLRGKNKRKLLSLISLLKGVIGLNEFERRIKSS